MARKTKYIEHDALITGILTFLAGQGYLDMSSNEIRNSSFQIVTTATRPATPFLGQNIYDSTIKQAGQWNGTDWVFPGLSAGDADTLDSQHGAWYLARQNHTGTQSASTIVDFAEAAQDVINSALVDSYSVDFTYDDANNQIKAELRLNGTDLRAGSGGVDLSPIAGLTPGTYTKVQVDSKGRVTAAFSITASDLPRLDQLTAPQASLNLNNQKITNLADPVDDQDGVNYRTLKSYAAGIKRTIYCRVATTGNVTLSGLQTIDGETLVADDYVLVRANTAQAENGAWKAASGAWTRVPEMDAWSEVPGTLVTVLKGTTYQDTGWLCTSDPGGTLGTTAITWTNAFGAGAYTASNGVKKVGNDFQADYDTGKMELIGGKLAPKTSVFATRKPVTLNCNGTTHSFPVNHGLGFKWVSCKLYNSATGNEHEPAVAPVDDNNCTLEFAVAPANGITFEGEVYL